MDRPTSPVHVHGQILDRLRFRRGIPRGPPTTLRPPLRLRTQHAYQEVHPERFEVNTALTLLSLTTDMFLYLIHITHNTHALTI